MSTKGTETSREKVAKLLEQLKESNPESVLQIEDYIKTVETRLQATPATQEESQSTLAIFDSIYSQSAILLKKSPDSDNQLLSWVIENANPATYEVLGTVDEDCKGHKLSDFIEASYSLTVPDTIDENYEDTFEVDIPNLFKYLVINVKGRSNGDLICCISDQSECYMLRNELNRHLQRFELITESINITSSNNSYDKAFEMILERVGFHLSPKRILVFIDNNRKGDLKYQWTAQGHNAIATGTSINHTLCESWNKMLAERKMILGFNVKNLPTDIANTLTNIGLHNAYIFPLANNDKTYGSILLETMEGNALDNFEINYIQGIATLLAGHISNKLITDDLIKEKERAQEADRLKSSFLVNMSHDIRIPMNAIIGFSDLLADEDLTQTEREDFTDQIRKSGQDLVTLIDNIIDISKIETGQMTVKKDNCKLTTLFNEILALYKKNSKLEECDDLSLQLDLPPKYTDIEFSTDIFKFKQIYTNLIDNAIKFTDSGFIKFGISKAWDNTIEFYVQDTGIGISEKELPIIFKRFSKVDRTFAKEYNGTGLGLSICQSLVEMLGGEIHVVSVLGKGSTFYFTHPLPCQLNDNFNGVREVKSPYNWKDHTIVVVDDNEDDTKIIKHILTNTGIDAVWLKNGNEALTYFEEGNFADTMLIELTESNLKATSKIHDISPVAIIAQTTNKSAEDRTIALKSGCSELIVKPINTTDFLATIDGFFAKK